MSVTSSIIKPDNIRNYHWQSHAAETARRSPSLTGINIDDTTKEILQAVADIGLITGEQLLSFYNIRKRQITHMCRYQMLVEHQMDISDGEGEKETKSVYTLGNTGAKIIELPHYKVDYWMHYDKHKIYQSIIFFEFFQRLTRTFNNVRIYPGIKPFTGAVRYKKAILDVFIYSKPKDFHNMMEYFRWKGSFNRMFFIADNINSLHQLKPYIEGKQIRLLETDDILQHETLNDQFYILQDRQFVKE